MDYDQLKNGCSMIIDPFGDVVAECRSLGDDITLATLTADKLEKAGGTRYRKARRPEIYSHIITKPHIPNQQVSWLPKKDEN